MRLAAILVPLALWTLLSAPTAVADHGGSVHGDFIGPGQTRTYNENLGCLDEPTEKVVQLVVFLWAPGDVLTLTVEALGGPISQPTTGVPPSAVLGFTSPNSCALFSVEGTQVALFDWYGVEEF